MQYETAAVGGGFTFHSREESGARGQEASLATNSFMVANLRRQLEVSKENEKNFLEEMVRQKMKAEKILDNKSLEADLMTESKKRKTSEEAAEKEVKEKSLFSCS